MKAEPLSASVMHNLAIQGPEPNLQGYYRSKIFIAPSSNNKLLAAAGPLFSLIERLSVSQALPNIDTIRGDIEHELHAFHSTLQSANYSTECIALAHYLLSATMDELLGKNYLRLHATTTSFQAFTPLSSDGAQPQQRFFDIVHYIKDRPTQHLDLIELAYFCLLAGFEGEQHTHHDGRQTLDNLIETLYLLIQKHRVNKHSKLFHEPPLTAIPRHFQSNWKFTALMTCGLLAVMVLSSHIFLDNKAKQVLHTHMQLAKVEDD